MFCTLQNGRPEFGQESAVFIHRMPLFNIFHNMMADYQHLFHLVSVDRADRAGQGVEAGDGGQPDAPLDPSFHHAFNQYLLK